MSPLVNILLLLFLVSFIVETSYSNEDTGVSTSDNTELSTSPELSTPPCVSGPPENITIETISSTAFIVSWERPECVPGQLISYNIEITYYPVDDDSRCQSNTNSTETFTVDSATTNFTFDKAAPYSQYKVRIAVKTEAGFGIFSNSTGGVTLEDVSDPPDNIVSKTINSTAFNVSWERPECVPGQLVSYNIEITYYPVDDVLRCQSNTISTEIFTVDYATTNFTFDNAAPYSQYKVRIAVKTEAGFGIFSDSTGGVTHEEVSDPPENIVSKTINSTAFNVSWERPECVPGQLISYNISITYYPVDDVSRCKSITSSTEIFTVDSATTTFTFDNAAPYSQYEVRIAVKTEAGFGIFSDSTGGVTHEEVSDPPDNIVSETINSTAFNVSWERPECVPGQLISYNISIFYYPADDVSRCQSNTNSTEIFTVDSATTNFTFDNAAPYSQYEVRIAVKTEAGFGIFSDSTGGVTHEEVSDPPENIVSKTINSTAFNVSWERPECVPGQLISYNISITYYPVDDVSRCKSITSSTEIFTVDSATTTFTFDNAAPYSQYEVRIAVKTEAGFGIFSDSTGGVTHEEVSDPPDNIVSETINSTAFNVSWERPECVPGQLISYNISIFYYPADDVSRCQSNTNSTEIFTVDSATTNFTFDNAAPYSQYEVRIAVKTEAGFGIFSDSTGGVTHEEVSHPPENIVSKTINSTAFNVSWERPECVPGQLISYNISIIYYPVDDVSRCKSTTSSTEIFTVDSATTTFTFDNAAPYSQYEVRIAVKTEAGFGIFSDSTGGVTHEEVSGPPENIVSKTIGSTAFDVSWERPECVPGQLISYNISITYYPVDDDSGCQSNISSTEIFAVDSATTTYTFGNAAPYSQYEVEIAVETGAGFGIFSDSTGGVTLEEVPSAPVITSPQTISSTEFIVIWEKSTCIPGVLKDYNISITYWPAGSKSTCSPGTNDTMYIIVDTNTLKYTFNKCAPYSTYEVKVAASTNAGQGFFSKSMSSITNASAPGPVQNLQVSDLNVNSTEAKFMWKPPCELNGQLLHYYMHFIGRREGYDDYNITTSVEDDSKQVDKLKFDFSYTVSVTAVVAAADEGEEIHGQETVANFKLPPGIPAAPHGVIENNLLNVDPYGTSDPTTQVLITLNSNLFDPKWGKIQHYAVLLAQESIIADAGILNSTNCSEWNVGTTHFVLGSPSCWNPFKNELSHTGKNWNRNQTVTYIVGDNTVIDNFVNNPLQPDTVYYLQIRGYTSKSFADTESIRFQTDSEVAVGMIVGVIIAILLMGIIASLLYMYRSGKLPWPPANLLKRATVDNVRPQPIPLKKFSSHCNLMLDIPARLSSEFQLMATLSVDIASTESFMAGQLPDNKRKNRYVNILPYDSTRVKLEAVDLDCDPSADYINASYIKGYTNEIEYIASQGPKEETCTDFWLMVYQQAVNVIIMVTQLEEQGKPKCYKYFPNLRDNLVMGEMTVRCTTELHFAIYSSRTLVLLKDDRKRTVVHLHFREWPDFGCPSSTDLMLQFCQVVRHHSMLAQPGLMLVHCSAGVGRTGTLIAMDILLQHIQENKKVDIFGTVFKLRKQRLNMVQTEAQYTYIYKCIKDAIEDPSYMKPDKSSTSSTEPIYENVTTTVISVLYEKVPESKSESECEL